MAVKVGINGFGRIGRNLFRAGQGGGRRPRVRGGQRPHRRRDAGPPAQVRLDPGPLPGRGRASADGASSSTATSSRSSAERDPADAALGRPGRRRRDRVHRPVHQARGRRQAPRGGRQEGDHLRARDRARHHRRAWASTSTSYDPEQHHIISNASCTTNCLAPVAKVLHESVGIEHGLMTTIHAYTADQRLQDMPHKDLRRARAAAINLIPTTRAPRRPWAWCCRSSNGKLNGMASARPWRRARVVDLTFQASQARPASRRSTRAVKAAAEGAAEGDPLLHRGPDRLHRHRRRPALLDLRLRADDRAGRQHGQGRLLVRQRVGLLEPLRRAGREGPAAGRAARRLDLAFEQGERSRRRGRGQARAGARRLERPARRTARIADDTRIRAALPTIELLRERGASVVLVSHLGRPKGADPSLSMAPVADAARRAARAPRSRWRRPWSAPRSRRWPPRSSAGEVLVLENSRFEPGETRNDPELAQGAGRRWPSSTSTTPSAPPTAPTPPPRAWRTTCPRYAGLLLEREVRGAGRGPRRPRAAAVRGARRRQGERQDRRDRALPRAPPTRS